MRSIRQFGVLRTAYDLVLRALNRLVYFRILKALAVQTPDPRALAKRPGYSYGFLSRAIVLSFAVDPQYEMSERFVQEALAEEDRCYGIVHDGTLASYGWYSRKPTTALTDDLRLRFDPSYVYMYKGFTHPAYRGQRLHAAGMAQALGEYRAEGAKGIVSYVESNNFSSLKSCYRMGYATFGHLFVVKALGRYFLGSSKGCRERGFCLEPLGRDPAPGANG